MTVPERESGRTRRESGRTRREKATLRAMIDMYCRAQHESTAIPCVQCLELREYAMLKVEKCRFRAEKPVCARCKVHCFRPDMRARVREVMRFSGPRMLLRHPLMAVLHVIDGTRTR